MIEVIQGDIDEKIKSCCTLQHKCCCASKNEEFEIKILYAHRIWAWIWFNFRNNLRWAKQICHFNVHACIIKPHMCYCCSILMIKTLSLRLSILYFIPYGLSLIFQQCCLRIAMSLIIFVPSRHFLLPPLLFDLSFQW